jgi:FHA domain/Zinc-ribbon containing domain
VELLTSGTIAGPGSFRCQRCDYVLTLSGAEELGECPRCAGRRFARASLFGTERLTAGHGAPDGDALTARAGGDLSGEERLAMLASVRARIQRPGQYLCFEADGELRTVALTREWTRIGRSLAADLRFDDPTVSRRHALVVRQADGVRVLDDRSLNGVFVNGARVEGRTLADGDEIVIGRHRLSFMDVASHSSST